MPFRIALVALAAAALSGCVYNKAVPVGNDTWRMETDVTGPLGVDIAASNTLRDAAELTLREGYTHFLLAPSPADSSDLGVRALLYGSSRVVYAPVIAGAAVASGGRAQVEEPTVRTSITVIMLRKNDPRIPQAYDALKVFAGTI